jgi:hypothetical protein
MTMNLTTTMFMSIDGVVQGPGAPDEDRSGGFTRGGWLVPHFDGETGQFMDQVFRRADAFLLGRRTYEIFAGSWGTMADPGADPVAVGSARPAGSAVTVTRACHGLGTCGESGRRASRVKSCHSVFPRSCRAASRPSGR